MRKILEKYCKGNNVVIFPPKSMSEFRAVSKCFIKEFPDTKNGWEETIEKLDSSVTYLAFRLESNGINMTYSMDKMPIKDKLSWSGEDIVRVSFDDLIKLEKGVKKKLKL